MDSNFNSALTKPTRSWLLTAILLAGIIGLLIIIAIPNFVRSGPSKISGIIGHLRQIEAAKQQWAVEHGVTNALQLKRELTASDLVPYLLVSFTRNDFGDPICGELYFIEQLNESPKAELTRDLREYGWPSSWKIPKGTVIVFVGVAEKYIFPGHESEAPKSLAEFFIKK